MTRNWTFGQRVGTGFAVTILLAAAIGVIAILAIQDAVLSKDRVIAVDLPLLLQVHDARVAYEARSSGLRGYLLTGEEPMLEQIRASRTDAAAALERLRRELASEEERRLVDSIVRAEQEYDRAIDGIVAARQAAPGDLAAVARDFTDRVVPRREALESASQAFVDAKERRVDEARRASSDAAAGARSLVIAITVIAALFGAAVAFVLTRSLSRQVGSAVAQVQGSSAELQAAANQQATGSREQATAMNEIATTISELLATSRQIAESAQRVAQIAADTAGAAGGGGATVDKAHESISAIRRQVDQVVGHMLELGKKSQQIGAVLDIVSELAEQTNILAINATIEAAGAGESGRRFAVVADEIRKLADRMGGSTKEIRALIEDVRGAVNTTVMATESGSKAVDAGSRQFADVTAAFQRIADLVGTTTEAAREIELSTKQQATAVEQVNLAISSVAQAAKESEVSSGQTLQTSSQLASLSRDLLRLVQPAAGA